MKKDLLAEKQKEVSANELAYERKKADLDIREQIMLEQFEMLKENVSAMTVKQEEMLKLQEIRQKRHELDIQESKLLMVTASQKAVDAVSSLDAQK